MPELLKLAGVGRKTANLLLGDAFGTPGLSWIPTPADFQGAWDLQKTQTRTKLSLTF